MKALQSETTYIQSHKNCLTHYATKRTKTVRLMSDWVVMFVMAVEGSISVNFKQLHTANAHSGVIELVSMMPAPSTNF